MYFPHIFCKTHKQLTYNSYILIYTYTHLTYTPTLHIPHSLTSHIPHIHTLPTITQIVSRFQYSLSETKLNFKKYDKIINRSIRLIFRPNKTITQLNYRHARQTNWMTTTNSTDYKLMTIIYKTITYRQHHNLGNGLAIKTTNRPFLDVKVLVGTN